MDKSDPTNRAVSDRVHQSSFGLVAGLPERPGSQQRHFLQAPKDVSVCIVLIYVQRIRGLTTMRYINLRFTYLLAYLLVSR